MAVGQIELAPELNAAVGFGLRRALAVSDAMFAATFAAREVTSQHYAILLTVRHNPGCQPSLVAGLLRITPANLVPPIDHLVSRGFIRRSLSTKDRRIRHLRLTPTGDRFVAELMALHDGIQNDLEGRMGADNLAELVRLLALYAAVEDSSA